MKTKKKKKRFKTKLSKTLRKELEEAVGSLYIFSLYNVKCKADSGLLKLITDYIETYGEKYEVNCWYLHIDLQQLVNRVIDELAEKTFLK